MTKAQRFKVTLSPDEARNRVTTEILDQGGIDYAVIPPSGEKTGYRNLPRVEAGGKTISDYDAVALRQFLVEQGAKFEDS